MPGSMRQRGGGALAVAPQRRPAQHHGTEARCLLLVRPRVSEWGPLGRRVCSWLGCALHLIAKIDHRPDVSFRRSTP
jgi:hypothetical protein